MVSSEFFINIVLRGTSIRNEYRKYFLGTKAAIVLFADFLEIWLPQPPGIIRDCPGHYMKFYLYLP
jgi:hypothetical protein